MKFQLWNKKLRDKFDYFIYAVIDRVSSFARAFITRMTLIEIQVYFLFSEIFFIKNNDQKLHEWNVFAKWKCFGVLDLWSFIIISSI